MTSHRFISLLACACIAFAHALPAHAQAWPTRPLKLILPFPPGSATDGASRHIAAELQKTLGQPVVIDNQPGADGIVAAQSAKRAAPDGYTYFVSTNSAHGVNPHIYKDLPYDAEKDFDPVAGFIRIPLVMLVRKDFPADDVAGFLRAAAQRGTAKPMSFGTGNTSSRVAAELFRVSSGIAMFDVPYRGTPQALADLAGGQLDMVIVDPYASMGLVGGGQIKPLAVTDRARLPLLPNVPTMAEAGRKDVEVVTWAAMFAPARTDPAIVDRVNREINRILDSAATRDYIHRMGATPLVATPAELRTFVTGEIERWGKLVDLARIPRK